MMSYRMNCSRKRSGFGEPVANVGVANLRNRQFVARIYLETGFTVFTIRAATL